LERAVVSLPLTERLVFLLHDVEGYSHERTAQTLGISAGESVFGLHQARIAIRQSISEMKV
jgi:RNA polymerase sigma-70 factor (ECF subfamily)